MENRKNNKKIVIYAILFIATLSVGIVIGINIVLICMLTV